MVSLITIVGALALVGGGASYYGLPKGLEMVIPSIINLKENGMVYPIFMNPPFPSIAQYYVYELMNPK